MDKLFCSESCLIYLSDFQMITGITLFDDTGIV